MVRALAVWVGGLGLCLALSWAVGSHGPRWAGVPVSVHAVLAVFALNLGAFVPAAAAQTERFYDLVGAVSHLMLVAVVGLAVAPDLRTLAVAGAVGTWALRLGLFLARRARAEGDARFDTIKRSPARFAVAWGLQSVWVSVNTLAAVAAITSTERALGPVEAAGLCLWALGFAIEVRADAEKARFRADPANRGRFMHGGLWSWSRHPNYVGEVLLWSGLAIAAIPSLHGAAWLALLSPLFVYGLLRHGSGVPLLEARAEARWGSDPEWQTYVREVPVFWPRPPRRRNG